MSQYKSRYVYKAGNSKWPTNSTDQPVYLAPKNFDVPFKLGTLVVEPLSDVAAAIYGVVNSLFDNGVLVPAQAQYLYVSRNNYCLDYSGSLADMYPATTNDAALTSASVWGSTIVAPSSFTEGGASSELPQGGIFNFVVMTPANAKRYGGKYRSRLGIIIGLNAAIITQRKDDLTDLIHRQCQDCFDSPTCPLPGTECPTCTPVNYGFQCLLDSVPATNNFVNNVITCINKTSKANSETHIHSYYDTA